MKYVFSFILFIHALMHLMGFVNAFYLTDINKQVLRISKPIGSFWLVTFILFVIASMQFLTHKKWFYSTLLAVVVSQILIILTWGDVKFGTIINVIIFIVGMSAFGYYRFQKMVDRESSEIFSNVTHNTTKIISEQDLNHLPDSIKTWLRNSGVVGNLEITAVRLKQKGEMRNKPNGKWMPFDAIQYFNVEHPAFVWSTNVDALPILKMIGRDKLVEGNSEVLIKLAALIPVVNESKNNKINSAAMIRYLAEICWFPSAALNDYMSWVRIDETSVKGTFTCKEHSVSGVFSFNTEGDIVSFEAQRYYGGAEDSKREKWRVEMVSFKEFNGVRIPNKSQVTWKLCDEDFNWLNIEVAEIDFNPSKLYKI